MMRIARYLAQAGITSRRKAETLVKKGLVRVNGKVIRDLAFKVDPDRDRVTLSGKPVILSKKRVYVLLYKPMGYLTASSDRYKRPLVKDLIKIPGVRLFPVGRLDLDSEGLLIMTNDGELTYRLTHPKFGIEKEYIVYLDKEPGEELESLIQGIQVGEDFLKAEYVERLGNKKVRIVLKEGKKREIRRMLGELGYKTKRLIRVKEGPLHLGRLKPGEYRFLKQREIKALKKYAGMEDE
ncbi:pseudouridine synthase [bacterium]|nr:MAG: pseudouridine synthase [bacterium]RKZ22318.1 MAG: pseudouridine synthase [bacterium]